MPASDGVRSTWAAINQRLDYRRSPAFATALSLGALILGLALGTAAHGTQNHVVKNLLDLSRPIGLVWLNGLQMIILPFVISHLIVAVCGPSSSRAAGRMAGLSVTWFVAMLAITIVFTIAAGSAILHVFPADPAARDAIRATADKLPKDNAVRLDSSTSLGSWVTNLLPGNLLKAGTENEFLPIVIATVLFAMAARQVKGEGLAVILSFARAIAATTVVLASWLFRLLPVAVLSLTIDSSAKAGSAIAAGIGFYVVFAAALLLVVTFALYPLTWALGGIGMGRFASAMLATQAVAISTRSSLASLPSLLDTAEKRLGLPGPVANFVLPLAVAVFKLNRAVTGPTRVIFLVHLYGLHIDAATMIMFSILLICLSFGSPGLPSGGQLLFMPIYIAMGLPLAGIILINAADAVTDLFKTLLNVTANMSVAAIVAKAESGQLNVEVPASERVAVAAGSAAGAL